MIPELTKVLETFKDSIRLVGVSLHLGSMMLELAAYEEALLRMKRVFVSLRADFPSLTRFDFGGGLGIYYDRDDEEKEVAVLNQYAEITHRLLGDLHCTLQSEPGRWLLAHAGLLITQVQYIKKTSVKTFVIVDAGMNHLIRPSLYEAEHRILPLLKKGTSFVCDVVGPICESSDFFAKDRELGTVVEGDYIAILDSGAYGYSMASEYNLQELPLEVSI